MNSRKIKVVQVITRLIMGGAQKVCLDLAEGLPRERYEVYLVTGSATGSEGSLWERARQIKELRLSVIPEMVRHISPLKDILALIKLHHFFRNLKPEIVHCHTSKSGFLGCLAARLAGVPVIIYSSHGHLFAPQARIPGVSGNFFRLQLFYVLRRIASACATRIIALNQADKQEQVQLKLAPPEKYEVIYNGIAVGDQPVSEVIAPTAERKVLYPTLAAVGRFTAEKGHRYLLEAVPLVKKDYPDVLLFLIGDGPLRGELEQQAAQLGIKDNVKFTGILPKPMSLLQNIDLFILPSLYEAFGLVLLEAMAVRKPTITSRVNGVPEVVAEGVTGLLVPPADSRVLADAIITLAKDKARAAQMGEAGYRRVTEFFRREKMVAEFDKLYQQLL